MKNCFAYIRVSTVKQGQHGSSLQEQRDAIILFARRHDLGISEWFEDRETAAKKGRTQFVRMMGALEKRKAAGVILHKIDRGARNLWDWARIQDLIDAGIEVRFAHDDLDLKSRGGRLAADIQAVVAADYVRNLREEVRKGMRGRLKQGFYPWRAPVGYLDQGKGQAKIVDPIDGPLVQAAFNLYATRRYSYETLALELFVRGLRGAGGKPLSHNSIATILRNPFYMGVVRLKSSGETFQGVHEPLVTARIFRAVQEIIDKRLNTRVRRNDFSYSRLLKCGLCSQHLIGELQKGRTYYRCHTRDCETTGIREDAVDAVLRNAVKALEFTEEEVKEMEPLVDEEKDKRLSERTKVVAAMKLHIAALENKDLRLTDAYIEEVLDRETYTSRRASLLLELVETRQQLAHQSAEIGDDATRLKKFVELIKAFVLGPEVASRSEYRRVVEILTSNRTLVRKNLTVAMHSPFREIICDTPILFGVPHRSVTRTAQRGVLHPTNESSAPDDLSISERRTRLLWKHLKNWDPPEFLSSVDDTRPEKVSPPQTFKRREPPQTESRVQ